MKSSLLKGILSLLVISCNLNNNKSSMFNNIADVEEEKYPTFEINNQSNKPIKNINDFNKDSDNESESSDDIEFPEYNLNWGIPSIDKKLSLKKKISELKSIRKKIPEWEREANKIYINPRSDYYYGGDGDFDLEEKINNYLENKEDEEVKVMAILGDTGSGKSTFLRRLELQLWDKYKSNKDLIPLWINLPALTHFKEFAVEETLLRYGFIKYEIEKLQENHKFILLVDSYDECFELFNVINKNDLEDWADKIFITSRAHHFNRVEGKVSRYLAPLKETGAPDKSKFNMLFISSYKSKDRSNYIEEYLKNNNSDWDKDRYEKEIENIKELKKLMRTPLLSKMIISNLPKLKTKKHIGINAVYESFMEDWYERQINKLQIKESKTFNEDEKQDYHILMDEYSSCLANMMKVNKKTMLNYKDSQDKKWKKFFIKEKDWLLHACPLKQISVSSKETASWQFLHDSMQTYYSSRATEDSLNKYDSSKPKTEEEQVKEIENLEINIGADSHIMMELRSDNVRNPEKKNFKKFLYKIVEFSKRHNKISQASANAISALNMAEEDFSGMDFLGIRIPGAILDYAEMGKVNLDYADLKNVSMRVIQLPKASLKEADLAGVNFGLAPFMVHNTKVNDIAIDEKALLIATASSDIWGKEKFKVAKLWSNHWNQKLAYFIAGKSNLTSIDISPKLNKTPKKFAFKDRYLVGGDEKGYIYLWSLLIKQNPIEKKQKKNIKRKHYITKEGIPVFDKIRIISPSCNSITCLKFYPNGKTLIASDNRGTISIIETKKWKQITTWLAHKGKMNSLDITIDSNYLATAGKDKKIKIWDLNTYKLIWNKNLKTIPYSIKFSPNNKYFLYNEDKNIFIYNLLNKALYQILEINSKINDICWASDSRTLACVESEYKISLWDALKGYKKTSWIDDCNKVIFLKEGQQLLSAGNKNYVSNWQVSKKIRDISFQFKILNLKEAEFGSGKGLGANEEMLIIQTGGKIYDTKSKSRADLDIKYYNKFISLYQPILGINHFSIYRCYNHLGHAYRNKGNYHKATELFEKALQIKKLRRINIASCYINLGLTYFDKGDYDKATEFLNKGLKISIEKLGENHLENAIIYFDLGEIYEAKGSYDKAIYFQKKALEIRMKKLEQNHLKIALSYSSLGSIYNKKGNYDKAFEFINKGLKIKIHKLGRNHPDVAVSYISISNIYANEGNYDKAIEFQEEALKIQINKLGNNHPDVAVCYNNLGLCYRNKGNYDKAIEFFEKDLKISLHNLGENHSYIATSYDNLGLAYCDKGDYDKAIKYNEKSLKIRIDRLGKNHPEVAFSYNNLGRAYYNKGNFNKAIELFKKSLEIKEKKLGKNHPDVIMSLINLGSAYSNKKNYDKAIEFQKKALDISVKKLEKDNPYVYHSYIDLGTTYLAKGNNDKGIEFLEKGLEIKIKKLGENHPDIALNYYNLGIAYRNKSNNNKATVLLIKAFNISMEKLGADHLCTRLAFNSLLDLNRRRFR